MRKQLLAASAALAVTFMSANAHASVTVACPGNSLLGFCTFDEPNSTGNFGDSFKVAQSFTDVFQLNLSNFYSLSITATNTASTGGPITFTTAALLDSAMTSLGAVAFGAVPTTFKLAPGTYYLKFAGSASDHASYGGTIDIASVPEPTTWAMMIGGLGVVGLSLRRRVTKVSFA